MVITELLKKKIEVGKNTRLEDADILEVKRVKIDGRRIIKNYYSEDFLRKFLNEMEKEVPEINTR